MQPVRRLLAGLIFAALSAAPAVAAPRVLATIKPVQSLVAAVMAGVGTPELLIQGGASEHSYVLKPTDAAKIADAQVIFWIGPDLETFLAAPLHNLAPDARIVALDKARGLTLLAARAAGLWSKPDPKARNAEINPHIWLDPGNAVAMVNDIARTLAAADPANAARYRANAEGEDAKLRALDGELARELAPVKDTPFLVFHDAYPYFTTHYGLDAAGAVTVEPGRPVSPQRIADLRAAVSSGHVKCLFREPQFPPALVATIARGSKVKTGVLDPLGAGLAPGPSLYPTLLRHLANSLVHCLL